MRKKYCFWKHDHIIVCLLYSFYSTSEENNHQLLPLIFLLLKIHQGISTVEEEQPYQQPHQTDNSNNNNNKPLIKVKNKNK